MRSLLFQLLITLVLASNASYGAEAMQNFPPDVAQFIKDREPCDYFRGEPRQFDESYRREGGKKALEEEAERADFLEKRTNETCANLDNRLRALNKKYASNKVVADKLAEFEYLEVGSGYVFIHKDFPGAKLIQQKLIARGFESFDVMLMKGVDWRGWNWDHPPPTKLTIQIGSEVNVFAAQLAIETLLEYGPKDIGVVVLPKENRGLALSMLVGTKPAGNFYIYSGNEIQNLLVPNLTRSDFDRFTKQGKPDLSIPCSKEMAACNDSRNGCVSFRVYSDATSTCDIECQTKLLEKLQTANIQYSLLKEILTIPYPNVAGATSKCVGYRSDINGTAEGAMCIAKLLGVEYSSAGCNGDGMAYTVRVH